MLHAFYKYSKFGCRSCSEMNQVEGTWEISDRVKDGAVIEYVDPKSTQAGLQN